MNERMLDLYRYCITVRSHAEGFTSLHVPVLLVLSALLKHKEHICSFHSPLHIAPFPQNPHQRPPFPGNSISQ